jgi:hypothetical protein
MDFEINWARELLGLFIWCLIIGFIIGISYLFWAYRNGARRGNLTNDLFDYKRLPDFVPKDAILMDTHAHTLYSDGKMTTEQTVLWHIANGFKVMVLSDHNTTKGNPELKELQKKYPEILLIPGIEWTTRNCHLVFMGIEEYPYKIPSVATLDDVKEAIARVHAMGGLVTIAHITWTQWQPDMARGNLVHPSREELIEAGVDGFEIHNEMRWTDPQSVHFVKDLNKTRDKDSQIYMCTGTDIHDPIEHWVCGWTELQLTEEEKKNLSWEVIRKVLKQGRTKMWITSDFDIPIERKKWLKKNDSSVYDPVSWQSVVFYPFIVLNGGLRGIPANRARIITLIIYALLSYPLFRLFNILLFK